MRTFFASALLLVALAACATPGERTAIGAGGGAAVGAGVGALAGGWEGAAIGAVVGGVAGGAIGNYLDKQAQELQAVTNARRTENGILVDLKSSLLSAPTARSSSRPRWSRSRNSATSSPNTLMIAFASRGIRTRRDPRCAMSSCRCNAHRLSATCLRRAASTRGRCSSKARERRDR